jgi:hypothetical protein
MPESTWSISVQRGPQVGRVHALHGEGVTIGRKADNDIVVDYPTVSRYHARLTWQGQTYRIEDLGTVNGTSVNGVCIDVPTLLRPGDTIGLGSDVVLSVSATYASAVPTAPPTPSGATPAQRSAPPPGWRRACIILAAAALALGVTAVLALGTWYLAWYRPRAERASQATSTPGPDLATVAPGGTVSPEMGDAVDALGWTIPLQPGGSVFVPEGALPQGAQLSARWTQMPSLPSDVDPVGQAVWIEAPSQPSRPVTLRLPVPPGVVDPSDLVIVRVEADGSTTFLVTTVQGDELVAGTPGFSAFAVVGMRPSERVSMGGREHLAPREEEAYRAYGKDPADMGFWSWSVYGMARIVYGGEVAVVVQAGDRAGEADLVFRCSDLERARDWFGWMHIRIITTGMAGSTAPFHVSVVPRPPVAYADRDTLGVTAGVHGEFETPITWTWEVLDGPSGGPVTTGKDTAIFQLPDEAFESRPTGTQVITVWAEDAQGQKFSGSGAYEWIVLPFRVAVEGPQRVEWSDPGAYEAYTAVGSGGEPPYAYTYRLFPGALPPRGRPEASDPATLVFDQPGEFRLEVTAEDGQERTVYSKLLIRVVGGEPLSVRALDLPAAAPGKEVSVDITIRGGVLVVGGEKEGYRLSVDWGDGGSPIVETDVGSAVKPQEGAVIRMKHDYRDAGTYPVRFDAWDATGSHDWFEGEIVVDDVAPSPEAPAEPTPGLLVWVRQEPAVVNVNDDPLEIVATEPRWAGTFSRMAPSEGRFVTQERYVEHEVEWFDLTITCDFDTPPIVLNPGLRYSVKVSCTHDGTNTQGGEGVGEQFWYSASAKQKVVDPPDVLKYYPWSPYFAGVAIKEWMVTAPPVSQEGDTFELYAGLWNRPPCNVTWTYRAEYH